MINNGENTFYKQMSQQTANPDAPAPIQNMSFSGSGLNDAVLGGSYNQITVATFVITAVAGSPNKFSWVETGGSGSSASNVNMTGSAQTLADGVTITFPATTGHTAGNTWTIVAIPTAREFWSSTGLKKVIWTDGSVVTMTGAGGVVAAPDWASPGAIGSTAPNTGAFKSLTIYDSTAVSGISTLTITRGAGQSSSALLSIKDSGGTNDLLSAYGNNDVVAGGHWNFGGTIFMQAESGLFDLKDTGRLGFSSGSNPGASAPDVALTRSAAGVFGITDGSTGAGRLKIGTSAAAASAILDLQSTSLGFLPPRMTEVQRDAISSPAEGLVIYNTTSHKLNLRVAAAWEAITSA